MAQVPTKCLEIESILVDACNPSSICGGSNEGQNEMVRFITGPQATNLDELEVNWPNNNWLGLVQNATTAANTAQLNATIETCGLLIEPVGGVIPPGSTVLLVTSVDMCIQANSFTALSDTIYIVFQNAGNTSGHFANNPASGQVISPTPVPGNSTRTMIMTYTPTGCSDTATYVTQLVVNNQGTYGGQNGESDGGTALFSWPGVPQVSYVNFGCQAPFLALQLTASADGTLCGGVGTVNLTGAVNGGDFDSIQWQGGTGTIGDPTSLNTTYTAGVGDTGSVVLQLCAITDCATPTCTTVIIPAGNGPTPQITPNGPTALCLGDNVVLTASGADTYAWDGGETTASITVFISGTYSVTGTNVCGTGSTSFIVTDATGVTVTVTGNLVVCPGQTTVLTANGASTYVWSTNETTQSITISQPGSYSVTGTNNCGTALTSVTVAGGVAPAVSIVGDTELCGPETTELTASGADTYVWNTSETTPAITVSTAGTYTITGTNACGSGTASVDVTAVAEPMVIITGNLTFCIGQPAILTASGADSYLWSTSETTPSISVETAGTISVVGTSACGTGTDSVEVTSAPGPTVTITGNTTICAGQTTVLTATGADTYMWSTNETSASITVGTAGTFTVTGTDGCGEAVAQIEVVFGAGPTVEIQGTTTFCAGESTQLTATGATSYVWSTSESFSTIAVEAPGTYTVIGTDACGSDTASVEVTVLPLPTVSISGVGSICPGETTVLTATSNDPITWNTSATGPTITVSDAGVYTATATNACGSTTASITVQVVQVQAAFTSTPTSGLAPLTVQFNSTSTPSGAAHSWDFDDNATSSLVSPEHLFEQPGTYTVVLAVTANGCTISTSQLIVVSAVPVPIEESSIEVPNVITPNGDRQNDILTVTTANLATFNMQIFNRWGQKMSELTRANQSWDARTLSGEMVSEGTYFYVLVAEGLDGKHYDLSGHLTVMR